MKVVFFSNKFVCKLFQDNSMWEANRYIFVQCILMIYNYVYGCPREIKIPESYYLYNYLIIYIEVLSLINKMFTYFGK